jgi:O-antigen/teichoic acid export membrane protein
VNVWDVPDFSDFLVCWRGHPMDNATRLRKSPDPTSAILAPGLGARVVGGGISSVGAQGAALLTSLVVTPVVIRRLGAEDYGVLTLVNLLISYLGFADLGMGSASTRFGAEALSRDGERGESAVVWTALLVTAVPALLVAAGLVAAAPVLLARVFGLTNLSTTVPALRIGAIVLLATALTGVANTPQLTRLRVGLNSALTMSGSITQACIILMLLSAGGKLVEVVSAMAGVAVVMACVHIFVSARISPGILRPRINLALARPLLRFGMGVVVAAATGVIVAQGEKFVLVRLGSVTDLAYYNVAFTLAGLIGIVPAAIMNPLMTALVHLDVSKERERSAQIYGGVLRGLLFWAIPAALAVCVAARPFFTVWAGPSFGAESTLPLFILSAGWLFQSASYVPKCALAAANRVDILARYQVYEVIPYFVAVTALVGRFGTAGAAAAWDLRAAVECWLLFRAARRITGLRPSPSRGHRRGIAAAFAILFLPVLLAWALSQDFSVLAASAAASIAAYAAFVYARLLRPEEKHLLWSLSPTKNTPGTRS